MSGGVLETQLGPARRSLKPDEGLRGSCSTRSEGLDPALFPVRGVAILARFKGL